MMNVAVVCPSTIVTAFVPSTGVKSCAANAVPSWVRYRIVISSLGHVRPYRVMVTVRGTSAPLPDTCPGSALSYSTNIMASVPESPSSMIVTVDVWLEDRMRVE